LIEQARNEIKYKRIRKTPEYVTIAQKMLKEIDQKFFRYIDRHEPPTEIEKISAIIFPKGNIINVDKL